MAYSIRPNNDFVLLNATQNDNPNQLDFLFFTDYTQHATLSNGGLAADGGAFNLTHLSTTITRSVTDQTDYGISGHGVIGLNSTNPAAFHRLDNTFILNGIPEPASGEVTKYEMEIGFEVTTALWASGDIYGYQRFGFMGPSSSNPSDGIYFEYWKNGVFDTFLGAYTDSTPFDNVFHIVFSKDGAKDRIFTNMPLNLNEVYSLYLCVQRFPTSLVGEDNVYVTYKITNRTLNTSESGQLVPLLKDGTTPTASADYMYMGWITYGIGAGQETLGINPKTLIDYMGARIQRPIKREILL